MKRSIIITLSIAAIALIAVGCNSRAKKTQQKAQEEAAIEQARQDSITQAQKVQKEKEAMATLQNLPDEPIFDIVTDLGTIKVRLYSKTAKHRENFAKLALSGYYDGLLFHRVINGFMIQGGDPFTRDTSAAAVAKYGQGGPGYTIPAEFVPEYKHKKGALAAARRGDAANPKKESSGSQFYIVQDPQACAQLDGDYTVFGETVEGLDVIDRIAQVATDKKDRPLHDVVIKQIKLDEKSTSKVEEKSSGENPKNN